MMRHPGLVNGLLLLLFVSMVVPCGLLEVVSESCCVTEEIAPSENGSDAPVHDQHLDCCTSCLICCSSYTELFAAPPVILPGTGTADVFFPEQTPSGSPFSIWRPPRS